MADYLPSVYFVKLTDLNGGYGLTNQILSLACSIIRGMFLNKKAIAIDRFHVDIRNNTVINISDIIDLEKINKFLKEKFNIVLLDKHKMVFNLRNAYIHNINKYTGIIDLCRKEMQTFISEEDNSITIPSNVVFTLKNDPIPKKFSIEYSLDDYNFFDNFDERILHPITSKVNTQDCNYDFYMFPAFIEIMPTHIGDILKNIHFSENFISKSVLNHNAFDMYKKVNVIHLRLEDDALQHWGKQNNMSAYDFKNYLETKYIRLIEKYFQKNELSVILTYSPENSVFHFLQNNGYTYFYVNKDMNTQHRELDAITDLFLSTKCNNVFIGNFWMKTKQGSTYSYYILQKLENPNIKKVAIHLDNITDEEDVFY